MNVTSTFSSVSARRRIVRIFHDSELPHPFDDRMRRAGNPLARIKGGPNIRVRGGQFASENNMAQVKVVKL